MKSRLQNNVCDVLSTTALCQPLADNVKDINKLLSALLTEDWTLYLRNTADTSDGLNAATDFPYEDH